MIEHKRYENSHCPENDNVISAIHKMDYTELVALARYVYCAAVVLKANRKIEPDQFKEVVFNDPDFELDYIIDDYNSYCVRMGV